MSNKKPNPAANGMGSPDTKGQGTTTRETGRMKADSSRKKQKRT